MGLPRGSSGLLPRRVAGAGVSSPQTVGPLSAPFDNMSGKTWTISERSGAQGSTGLHSLGLRKSHSGQVTNAKKTTSTDRGVFGRVTARDQTLPLLADMLCRNPGGVFYGSCGGKAVIGGPRHGHCVIARADLGRATLDHPAIPADNLTQRDKNACAAAVKQYLACPGV